MSIPIAAAMIATTVATSAMSAGMSIYSQTQQRNAQKKQRAEQMAAATASSTANYDQLNLRRSQETEAAGQSLFENQRQTAETTSRARVAASEAGVSGNSVEMFLRDLYGRGAGFQDSVVTNLENTGLALDAQGVGVRNQTQSAFNSAVKPRNVDYLGTAMNFAGGVAQGVTSAYGADLKIGAAGGETIF